MRKSLWCSATSKTGTQVRSSPQPGCSEEAVRLRDSLQPNRTGRKGAPDCAFEAFFVDRQQLQVHVQLWAALILLLITPLLHLCFCRTSRTSTGAIEGKIWVARVVAMLLPLPYGALRCPSEGLCSGGEGMCAAKKAVTSAYLQGGCDCRRWLLIRQAALVARWRQQCCKLPWCVTATGRCLQRLACAACAVACAVRDECSAISRDVTLAQLQQLLCQPFTRSMAHCATAPLRCRCVAHD